MNKQKMVPVLSIVLVAIFLIAFFLYWFYRFYRFLPSEGTSSASISALWGQFIVSLLLVLIASTLIIYLDRRYDIKFYKLVSFWIIVLLFATGAGYYIYKGIFPLIIDAHGKSDTHILGETFNYNQIEYKLTKSNEDLIYIPGDCSKYTNTSRLSIYNRGDCERDNSSRKKESEESTLMVINITAKNNSASPQDVICKDCLVLRNSSGDVIDQEWSLESQSFSNQLFPGDSVQMSAKYKVRKNELNSNYHLTFVTNKAPEYVEIK